MGNSTSFNSAEPAIEDEPFAVLWGDEFIYSKPPRLAQMIKVYEKFEALLYQGVKIENKRRFEKDTELLI